MPITQSAKRKRRINIIVYDKIKVGTWCRIKTIVFSNKLHKLRLTIGIRYVLQNKETI